MKTSSQLLLTFFLNAVWQIALVAALASFSSWLLRNSAARYLHWIWVSALLVIRIRLQADLSSEYAPMARLP